MKNYKKSFINILLSFLLSICLLILAVKIVVIYKPLYYKDIRALNIEEHSMHSETQLKETYDYLINYISGIHRSTFSIPNFCSSKCGIIHFKEVRTIYQSLNYLYYAAAFFILVILLLFQYIISEDVFLYSAVFLSSLTLSLCIPFSINFDESFTEFHNLLFKNNYWLFDPVTDPVITALPEEFFLHCSLSILLIVALESLLLITIYKKRKNP